MCKHLALQQTSQEDVQQSHVWRPGCQKSLQDNPAPKETLDFPKVQLDGHSLSCVFLNYLWPQLLASHSNSSQQVNLNSSLTLLSD
jgi:hypothetical protein